MSNHRHHYYQTCLHNVMCCTMYVNDAHGRFEPCKFAYFVSFDISVIHMKTHTHTHSSCTLSNSIWNLLSFIIASPPFYHTVIISITRFRLQFSILLVLLHSYNPHNNNPAAMNSTFYAWMLGIILCDACLPFCNHYCSTTITHTRAHFNLYSLSIFFSL